MEFNDLGLDCLYLIANSDLLTSTDLENLRKTCSSLNYVITKYNLIQKKCPKTHNYVCYPFEMCGKYYCCNYFVENVDNWDIDTYPLYNAVYNEWYDLIKVIISKKVFTYQFWRICKITHSLGIAIDRGNLKLLDLLFSNVQICDELKKNDYLVCRAISRLIKFNNIDIIVYLKNVGLFSDVNLCKITIKYLNNDSYSYFEMYFANPSYYGTYCHYLYDFKYTFVADDNKVDNEKILPFKNIGYFFKYYCENIDTNFAKNRGYELVRRHFPEYYYTLMKRIRQ